VRKAQNQIDDPARIVDTHIISMTMTSTHRDKATRYSCTAESQLTSWHSTWPVFMETLFTAALLWILSRASLIHPTAYCF